MYAQVTNCQKKKEQKAIELKREIDKTTIIVGNFHILFLVTNRISILIE